MKHFLKGLAAGLVAALLAVGGIASAQNVDNYTEQGGARTVIGGSIDVVSGGDLDLESGSTFKIAGATVSATAAELDQTHIDFWVTNISSAQSIKKPSPATGVISACYSVIDGAITTLDAILAIAVGTTAGFANITVAQSGSADGTEDSVTGLTQAVTQGGAVVVGTNGASTNSVGVGITCLIDQ